jgi:hypothetical protein
MQIKVGVGMTQTIVGMPCSCIKGTRVLQILLKEFHMLLWLAMAYALIEKVSQFRIHQCQRIDLSEIR